MWHVMGRLERPAGLPIGSNTWTQTDQWLGELPCGQQAKTTPKSSYMGWTELAPYRFKQRAD